MAEAIKSLGETIAELIEKLAGKGTNLQRTFKDLTFEWAGMKSARPRTMDKMVRR